MCSNRSVCNVYMYAIEAVVVSTSASPRRIEATCSVHKSLLIFVAFGSVLSRQGRHPEFTTVQYKPINLSLTALIETN